MTTLSLSSCESHGMPVMQDVRLMGEYEEKSAQNCDFYMHPELAQRHFACRTGLSREHAKEVQRQVNSALSSSSGLLKTGSSSSWYGKGNSRDHPYDDDEYIPRQRGSDDYGSSSYRSRSVGDNDSSYQGEKYRLDYCTR
ncbi:unnamed protein product, partial [Amoebophrya sp. A25]|eukprot:GSA25T00025908001.1